MSALLWGDKQTWSTPSACMLSWESSSQLYSKSCRCLEHPVGAPHGCIPGTVCTNARTSVAQQFAPYVYWFQFTTAKAEVTFNNIHFLSHTSSVLLCTLLIKRSDTNRQLPPTSRTLEISIAKSMSCPNLNKTLRLISSGYNNSHLLYQTQKTT